MKETKRKSTASKKTPRAIDQLNLREKRLIKKLADPATKNVTEAMRYAGYSESVVKKQAKQVVGKPRIEKALNELMEEMGLTNQLLMSKIVEGIEATKVISANVIAKNGEGMADAHSMTKDFIDVPDFPTRHKYVDTALKLKNLYPAEKSKVEVEFVNLDERLAAALERARSGKTEQSSN